MESRIPIEADGLVDAASPEKKLTAVALRLAVLEKAACGVGALGFIWATVVLLGGFAIALERADFWFVTVILLVEGARIFSRSHELEWQHQATWSLGEAGALSFRAIRSSSRSAARAFQFLFWPSAWRAPAAEPPSVVLPVSVNDRRRRSPELLGCFTSKVPRSSTCCNWQSAESPLHPYGVFVFNSSFISRLLYWLQLVSATACVVLSLMRLAQQDYGEVAAGDESTKRNRGPALNIFYGLALSEALLFLAERAYWEWKVSRCHLLEEVNRVGFMAIKVDMEQAYDRMSWQTLEQMLFILGFPARFSKWVIQCVTHPRYSILLNGRRTEWVRAQCGFHQGCPLSPYLFILCSELLTQAFKQRGANLGMTVTPGGTRISNLLYADDILITSQALVAHGMQIKAILDDYCSWTGQRINSAKTSILFSKAAKRWRTNRITRLIGFRRVQEMDYLGLKLAMRRLFRTDHSQLIQRAREKISAWGARHLSLAGRATLISTALLPGSVYQLTHTMLPMNVSQEIEKMCRSFLWDKSSSQKSIHYVKWASICTPRKLGGLGFHSAATWTGPLRARLAWDFLQKPDSLLHRCLRERYGDDIWDYSLRRGDSKSWAVILSGAQSLKPLIRWKLADGNKVHVLSQTWLTDIPLSRKPTFLDTATLEDLRVCSFIQSDRSWDIGRLELHFGKDLVDQITGVKLHTELVADEPELIHLPLSKSLTALAYEALFPPTTPISQWLQKLQLHPREKFFWWRVLKGALPTLSWLRHRGLTEEVQCPWGCTEEEDLEHILTRCSLTTAVLQVLSSWGFVIPSFICSQDLFEAFDSIPKSDLAWGKAYCYVIYQVWRARNAKIHGSPHGTPKVLAANILEAFVNTSAFPFREQWEFQQPHRLIPHTFWTPPPPGWLKANVDGALFSSSLAGIGVVIRDDTGNLIKAAGIHLQHWDSTQVELQAMLAIGRILEPWMYECKGLILEGDNHGVVTYLQQTLRQTYWTALPAQAPDIGFLSGFHQVIFSHICRDRNRLADYCARLATKSDFVWHPVDACIFPPAFSSILDMDREHVATA